LNECPKCGKEYNPSRKDKSLRKMVSLQSMMFPALKEVCRKAKDYCNECWKAEVDPAARKIMGEVDKNEPRTKGKV